MSLSHSQGSAACWPWTCSDDEAPIAANHEVVPDALIGAAPTHTAECAQNRAHTRTSAQRPVGTVRGRISETIDVIAEGQVAGLPVWMRDRARMGVALCDLISRHGYPHLDTVPDDVLAHCVRLAAAGTR